MSEEQDKEQKTEHPTGKRLSEARSQGQLPISREVSAWGTMAAIWLVVMWLAPGMAKQLILMLRVFIESPHSFIIDDHGLQTLALNATIQVVLASGLIFALLAIAAVLGIMLQTGFFYSTELIRPDFSRLNPIAGFKKLFNVNALVEFGKSIIKLVVLGYIAYWVVKPVFFSLPAFIGKPLFTGVEMLHERASHLIIVLLSFFTIIAVADFYYQRWSYIKNLKMTKEEVKDEYKQMEGDPAVKSRLRQIRLEKARKRMMARVPKADVVITNPTHYAVALQYDAGKMGAPRVIAKGIDRVAERIREVAQENQVSMVSNPPLARALYDAVELEEEIPAQHYRAVAEIISYVYKLKKRRI